MKKFSCLWIFILAIIVITMFIGLQLFNSSSSTAESLSTKDAKDLVKNRYRGSVTEIHLSNSQYLITLRKENSLYDIKLDAKTGKILSVIKSKANALKPNHELTEDQVRKIVAANTKGTISSIQKLNEDGNEIYNVYVNETTKKTMIKVDAVSGNVLSISANTTNEPIKKLTEAEAAQLATDQVNGTVSQIIFETKNEQPYYLFKVTAKAKREAVVQVHAITGMVMSVTWDDHSKGG